MKKKTKSSRRRPQKHVRRIKVGKGLKEVRIILVNEDISPPVKKKRTVKRKPKKMIKRQPKKTTKPVKKVVVEEEVPEEDEEEELKYLLFDERVPIYIEEKIPMPYDPNKIPSLDEINKNAVFLVKPKPEIPTIKRQPPRLIKVKQVKDKSAKLYKEIDKRAEKEDRAKKRRRANLKSKLRQFEEEFEKARPRNACSGKEEPRPKQREYPTEEYVILPEWSKKASAQKANEKADRKRQAELNKAQKYINKEWDELRKRQKKEAEGGMTKKERETLSKKIKEEEARIAKELGLSKGSLKIDRKSLVKVTPAKKMSISTKNLPKETIKELKTSKFVSLNLNEEKKPQRIKYTIQTLLPDEFSYRQEQISKPKPVDKGRLEAEKELKKLGLIKSKRKKR